MSDVNNPFLIYAYAGPKYFCDRIEETEHLISALRNGRNVTLMSPRRMGKTGLIQNVFHQIRRVIRRQLFLLVFFHDMSGGFYHSVRADCDW